MGSLYASHYLIVIMALQLIGGVLLLSSRFQALALLIVAPLVVNIFLFHAFMQPSGLPLAIVLVLLWFGAAWNVRSVFSSLLRAKVDPA